MLHCNIQGDASVSLIIALPFIISEREICNVLSTFHLKVIYLQNLFSHFRLYNANAVYFQRILFSTDYDIWPRFYQNQINISG